MRTPSGDSQLVQIVDAALADAIRRAGDRLACRPGCTQCCHGAFAINPLDALRLADGVHALWLEDPDRAARVDARAHAWLDTHESAFPGDPATGLLDDSPHARDAFAEFANDDPCPALDPVTGLCDLYAHRPMTCRVFGPPVPIQGDIEDATVLGHCELCFIGATTREIADCEMSIPHDEENALLEALPVKGETIVAYALRGALHR